MCINFLDFKVSLSYFVMCINENITKNVYV